MSQNGFLESFLWPACMWLTHAFVGLLLIMVSVSIVPISMELFANFDADLPAATQRLLQLSDMLVHYWYLAIPFLAIVDAAILFGLSQVPPKLRWLRSLWFNAIMLATILFLFFSMAALAVPLRSLSSLHPSLILSGAQNTDALLEHVGGLTRLQGVDQDYLDGSYVGLEKLRSLYLDGSDVTDAGLVNLKSLTNLKRLDLSFTQVTDAGLVHLKGLTKLKYLGLNRTQVTDEGVKKLQGALPNCEIYH